MLDTDLESGRPHADECLPYYFGYIRLVPDGHVVERLAWPTASASSLTARYESRPGRPGAT